MEHTVIAPPRATALPPDMLDTLAQQGLASLLFAPIPKVARALAGFDREQLGTAIEIMIAMLDAADGDPDVEADDRGGEAVALVDDPEMAFDDDGIDPDEDGQCTEDEISTGKAHLGDRGPGCTISDPDAAIDDGPCDDIDQDREPEEELTPDWGIDQTEPLSEALTYNADHLQMREHRDRIRRDSCTPRYYRTSSGGLIASRDEFRLLAEPIVPSERQLITRKRGVPRKPRP